MSIAERLLLIAAGLLSHDTGRSYRSRCPPGEHLATYSTGNASSKKDQPQFYTVRRSRFDAEDGVATEAPQGGSSLQTEVALTEKQDPTFRAEVF